MDAFIWTLLVRARLRCDVPVSLRPDATYIIEIAVNSGRPAANSDMISFLLRIFTRVAVRCFASVNAFDGNLVQPPCVVKQKMGVPVLYRLRRPWPGAPWRTSPFSRPKTLKASLRRGPHMQSEVCD